MQTEVLHRPDEGRYVVLVDGREAGYGIYRGERERAEIPYTEVVPEFGGQGVGSALVRGMLEDLRARGVSEVVPTCSFVASVMRREGDLADLLAGSPTS